MWRDPGTWIALGVSALFVVAAVVMHRVFLRILQQGEPPPPPPAPPTEKPPHE
ncbi:hypothetical protein [Macromonas nakdongensis]|uniref:hypothetical protein n=1 Tax=Macromonas nakdongensis TaxID=1843082 RepID=UPI0018E2BA0C|nr:hypothetical protein [Macromonas nakdongensis]